MVKRTYWKSKHGYLWGVMWVLVAFYFTGCKDEDDQGGTAFDPNKPIVIERFTPESGGYGSNLILYGENFGNDVSRVKVVIGGKTAKVISVKGESLYCVIPEKAYDGDIQVSVLDENGEVVTTAEADKRFIYEKKWLVSTFLGTRYENSSDFEEKEGPFGDCGGFQDMYWFSFDPKSDNDILYITKHTKTIRKVDFTANDGEGYVYNFSPGGDLSRAFCINWTADENQDMVISDDTANGSTLPGGYVLSRSSGFTSSNPLPNAVSVNGAMIHPKNGELYYSCYYGSDVYRLEIGDKEATTAFVNTSSKAVLRMVPHPDGEYAYLIQYNKHFIAKVTYDHDTKTFKNPLPVCGKSGTSGYEDGTGTNARLSSPCQGVFVYNEKYTGDDKYDFYFCDEGNHAVRILTPEGRVSTYAGRGSDKESGYADGNLRTEALFNKPMALAYDEKRKCFYVGDNGNKVIRKIAKEGSDEETGGDEEQEAESGQTEE